MRKNRNRRGGNWFYSAVLQKGWMTVRRILITRVTTGQRQGNGWGITGVPLWHHRVPRGEQIAPVLDREHHV